ncbi:hypothetical protein ACH5RR_029740 [Cinchona calisaya]|uniref:Uncharacterized protein n=1 Tax=Cinchona calisaya TaxID=153742 RepID=A0ABD2YVT3_9GENT
MCSSSVFSGHVSDAPWRPSSFFSDALHRSFGVVQLLVIFLDCVRMIIFVRAFLFFCTLVFKPLVRFGHHDYHNWGPTKTMSPVDACSFIFQFFNCQSPNHLLCVSVYTRCDVICIVCSFCSLVVTSSKSQGCSGMLCQHVLLHIFNTNK